MFRDAREYQSQRGRGDAAAPRPVSNYYEYESVQLEPSYDPPSDRSPPPSDRSHPPSDRPHQNLNLHNVSRQPNQHRSEIDFQAPKQSNRSTVPNNVNYHQNVELASQHNNRPGSTQPEVYPRSQHYSDGYGRLNPPIRDEGRSNQPMRDEPRSNQPMRDETRSNQPMREDSRSNQPMRDEPRSHQPINQPIRDESRTGYPIRDEGRSHQPIRTDDSLSRNYGGQDSRYNPSTSPVHHSAFHPPGEFEKYN